MQCYAMCTLHNVQCAMCNVHNCNVMQCDHLLCEQDERILSQAGMVHSVSGCTRGVQVKL